MEHVGETNLACITIGMMNIHFVDRRMVHGDMVDHGKVNQAN